MIFCNFGSDGYLLSVSVIPAAGLVPLDESELLLSDNRLSCYKMTESGDVLFDFEKYAALPQNVAELRADLAQLSAQLAATDAEVIEAVEHLFAAESLTGFLEKLVATGAAIRETLTQRAGWRARIAEIKSALQEG